MKRREARERRDWRQREEESAKTERGVAGKTERERGRQGGRDTKRERKREREREGGG